MHPSLLLALFAFASSQSETFRGERTALGAGDPPAARETVAGGEVTILPLGEQDDGVPLPQPAVVEAREDGDVLRKGPSGDPFFLGFAAGPHRPPVGERVDPQLASAMATLDLGARPGGATYAFVMFASRMTEERVAALEAAGARVLGFHPHYCLKVALRPEALDAVAALPFVRWVGTPRRWQRVHPYFEREAARAEHGRMEVYVNVYDSDLGSDSTFEVVGRGVEVDPGGAFVPFEDPARLPKRWLSRGWQERTLIEAGLEVISYDDGIRAFRGLLEPARVDALLDLDFVQFVEPVFASAGLHDESMPMIHADRNRAGHDGGENSAAVVAVVDSGYDIAHTGLNHVWALGWDISGSAFSQGPWQDNCGHGSHVAGTVLGLPQFGATGFTGAAPGLGWGATGRFFNVKLWHACTTFTPDLTSLLDIVGNNQSDASGNVTPRPHLINHSWGSVDVGPYWGTEADARAFDLAVYGNNQQHVFAAGNLGPAGQTLNLQSSAKNVLSVGNVNTYLNGTSGFPGNVWVSSSRGPTADLRWGPKLCAPGTSIRSVDAGTGTGYTSSSGTSMASPHVVGVAAQLVDEHPFLRYNAATLSAVLMAGTLTKDSALLSVPSFASTHHLNMYGTGRIDATKARGGNAQQATYFWGFTQGSSSYGQVDFTVGAGATQLTVVMHYKEFPASAGASQALLNDLDLWIDQAPFQSGGNTGDYFAQHSARDNTEVRILDNPGQGTWRLKVFPEDVPNGLFNTSDVGLCAIVTYGDVTPDATLTVLDEKSFVQPLEEIGMTARVYNPSYYASAVYLDSAPGGAQILEAEVTLADGIVTDLSGNNHDGYDVLLGNILGLTSREVRWRVRWALEGIKVFAVTASADNIEGGTKTASQTIIVDGTAPVGPTNLASTTHPVGVPTCSNALALTWTAATDVLAGLEGYRGELTASPDTEPTGSVLNYAPTATSAQLTPAPGTWWFHLRARDRSGNWGTTQHYGPIVIQPGALLNYCTALPNSTGQAASISGSGSLSQAANAFTLACSGLPTGLPSIYFYAPGHNQVPFGNGVLCVSGTIVRLPLVSTGTGTNTFALDFTNPALGGAIAAGTTVHFQNWYRDPAAGGANFNLSNGLQATFCP